MSRTEAPGGTSGGTTPLYIVCSPCRCVGKTLLARLLAEYYLLADRPVAAFDLADEGPQLSGYLPQATTVADIADIRGQMAFFDRLLADNTGAKVIDVSHRAFKNFFAVVQEIGFFEEARRRAVEPLILFIVDPDPKAPKAYAGLRRRFTEASLLPVRNRTETGASAHRDAATNAGTLPALLDIPLLGFSLRALIDRQGFSFHEFWRASASALPDAANDELCDWVERIFLQFRGLALSLGCEHAPTPITAARRRGPRAADRPLRYPPDGSQADHRPSDVPCEVLRFAPKRKRGEGIPIEQSGNAIVDMVHDAGRQLRTAEDRIGQLETEIEQLQSRAVRAEAWLQLVGREIEEKLIEPAAATRSKIDDLGS
jgi:hypothetical protein